MLLSPRPAHARDLPGLGSVGQAAADAVRDLYFYAQVQAGSQMVLADGHPGGWGVHAAVSVVGLGASAGLRYEQDRAGDHEVRRGGLTSVAFELRPVGLAQSKWHRFLDPILTTGGEIGASSAGFRATLYTGAGLDVGLFPAEEIHPAITIQYRFRPVQTPGDFAKHTLHIGAAWRAAF